MKTVVSNPGLIDMARDAIAADLGLSFIVGAVLLGAVLHLFQV